MPWPRSRTRRRNPPRHDDLTTGNPLARPHTLLIDSEELESGEALDDKFRAMAADEIDCFRRDIVERTGDARAAETIIDQALLPQDNAPPKEMILRVHLVPALGHKRLDAIKSQDVQHLEGRPEHEGGEEGQQRAVGVERAVTQGVEWDVLERMPCTVRLLPSPQARRPSTISTTTNDSSKRRVSSSHARI